MPDLRGFAEMMMLRGDAGAVVAAHHNADLRYGQKVHC